MVEGRGRPRRLEGFGDLWKMNDKGMEGCEIQKWMEKITRGSWRTESYNGR